MTVHSLEVMPDHVHLFVETDPTLCVAEIVNRFKGRSSRVLRQEFPKLRWWELVPRSARSGAIPASRRASSAIPITS